MQKLLDSIAILYQQELDSLTVNGWRITRISGGMNGLVYRAERESGAPLAVKICQRDERNRAGREYASMRAMDAAGLSVAPKVLYLAPEPAGLPGAAVISEWLAGDVLEAYPAPGDHGRWVAVLESLAQVHSLTPEDSSVRLSDAALCVLEPEDILREIHLQMGRLPSVPDGKIGNLERRQLEHLAKIVEQQTPLLRWEYPVQRRMIHCDPNARNMIEFEGTIRLVDWENSGWGDPAFDIADLCANPMFGMVLPAAHHAWMREEHSRLLDDPTLPERAAVYTRLLHVWWVMRNGRYLVEANTRLKGIQLSPTEAKLAQQQFVWERTCALFQIDSE
jgi:thiamine kinase-like enzyme